MSLFSMCCLKWLALMLYWSDIEKSAAAEAVLFSWIKPSLLLTSFLRLMTLLLGCLWFCPQATALMCRLYKGITPLWGRQIPYTMMKFGESPGT